ncbi:Uncharacterised protein [Bordetella pertussis]|nr:Uncharacterised protein [Bordetella pertussis]CPL40950.1 Uncharacterised protein [Bordetella pertussis]
MNDGTINSSRMSCIQRRWVRIISNMEPLLPRLREPSPRQAARKRIKKGEPDSPYSVPETVPDQPPEFTTNRPANHPRRARKKAAFGVCLQA